MANKLECRYCSGAAHNSCDGLISYGGVDFEICGCGCRKGDGVKINLGLVLTYILIVVFGFLGFLFSEWCDEADASEIVTGKATYYTEASCQREGTSRIWTASGERYDESAFTCALPHREFGKQYRVRKKGLGYGVVVRHNDFGPGKGPQSRGVVIDLSPAAFKEVCGDLSQGICEVEFREVS